MKQFFLSLSLLFGISVLAQNDTIQVSAHDNTQLTWYGNYDANALFPTEGNFEEITMNFTLGCSDGGCSHWDYTVAIYLMEPTGLLDSSIVSIDTLVTDSTIVDTTWNIYPVLEKFELGRLITPYGNYMDWNSSTSDPNDLYGASWTHNYEFDITDYAPLLNDSSLIRVLFSGWPQEGRGFSASINFDFIKGTPPLEVLSIENMYPVGSYSYQSLADNDHFVPITKNFDQEVTKIAVKSIISGHGHEGPQNCCEWVSKQHGISIDGEEYFQWDVWNDCGMIPIYPQGGTWPFDRAGWCPGTKVDMETTYITDFIEFDQDVLIDYTIQGYSNNGESDGSFIVSNTLFTYGAHSFSKDIEIVDIIAPSTKDAWSRKNPICASPKIIIKNRGSELINTVRIEYGIEGQDLSIYEWSGAINYSESAQIDLPNPNWTGTTENSKFIVNLLYDGDEYTSNNTLRSSIEIPDVLPQEFVFEYRTQVNYGSTNRAIQSSYTINDAEGELLYEQGPNGAAFTWHKDTISLNWGCYVLTFKDAAEDGVNEYWYNGESSSAAGIVQIRNMEGNIIKKFPDDFGQQIDYHFTVDYPLETTDFSEHHIEIFPNPASDNIQLSMSFARKQDVAITIYNNLGTEVYFKPISEFTSDVVELSVIGYAPGVYYAKIRAENGYEQTRKFVISE